MIKKHWLSIASKCNNFCLFCLDADNQKNGSFKDEREVIKSMKDGLRSRATRLILSGGEATIHPHFIEFIKIAKKLGYREIQVITNGRMFAYKNFLDQAVSAGLTEITFSIHSHRKDLYEKLTGSKDSYAQVISGLKNALTYPDLILNIDIVINRLNYKNLYQTIMFFAKNFGIYEYDLLQIMPSGRAWKNQAVLFYNIEKSLPYLKKVFNLAKNDKRFHIWTNRFPAQYLEDYEFLIQSPQKIYDDIQGAQNMFDSYLSENKKMPCLNKEKCSACNLNDFCRKLILFNKLAANDSRLKSEIAMMIRPADCLQSSDNQVAWQNFDFLNGNNKIDLLKFADFYIKNLYKIKSLRCKDCKHNNNCYGVNINYIIKNSFKVIKPILK